MKIKTISMWMPLLLLLFFLPDGMLTIRNSDYILNAIFLKKEWLLLLIEIGYKMRNLIGGMLSVYMLLNGVKYVKCNNFSIRYINIFVVFSIYSLWIFISTYLNHGDIYNAAITGVYCTGFIYLLKELLIRFGSKTVSILNRLLIVLAGFNMLLVLFFPNGITTGNDYISTAYHLMGTKNSSTPFMILTVLTSFMVYEFNKSGILLFLKLIVIGIGVMLMKSGTSILVIVVMILLFYINKIKSCNQRNDIFFNGKWLVILASVITIGVVFFNAQSMFRWLIVGILQKDLTLSGRTDTWSIAIQQYINNPIIGYGYGHMITGHYYAHNLILELLVTSGLMGCAAYLYCFLIIYKSYVCNRKYYNFKVLDSVVGCGLVALIIANIGEAFIFNCSQLAILVLMQEFIKIYNTSIIQENLMHDKKNRYIDVISIR